MRLLDSIRRIAPLAWPVFVGQVAVLAFSTVDTVMVARHSALDLAALAVGAAVYITVFIGLMGVVLAIGPIAGQLYGAGKWHECGRQLHQSMWLALALSVIGCAVLLFPQPFLALSRTPPEVAVKVRGYLNGLAFALPMALLFTAYRGFNIAVSRPKAVMALQVGALVLKVPMTALLVFGIALPAPYEGLSIAALGAPGCGIATAIVMTGQMLAAWWLLQRDPFYRRFALHGRLAAPHRASLAGLLRLGLPMGLSILIEITGFTFMAFFISRIGAIPVAGHQIAVNLVAMLFMMPLAIANAASTLVAQRVGADDAADARRLGWHSLEAAVLIAVLMGGCLYLLRRQILGLYTDDAVWEGVGEYYDNQFGRAEGKAAIREHFQRFWPEEQDPELVLNAHYLTSEQIHVDGDEAEGTWIHMQPWLFSDGRALLRSSRLNNAFRATDEGWRITRTRTENVFISDLPRNFASDHPSHSVLFK